MKKLLWWIVVIIAAILVITYAKSNKSNSGSSASTFKIALSAALTGPAAFAGENYLNGLHAAQKKINADGGINGKPIEFLIEDNKYEAATGLSAYQKLVTQKPDVFIQTGSPAVAAVSPVAEKDGQPIFVAVNFADVSQNHLAVSFYPTTHDDSVATVSDLKLNKISKIALLYLNGEYPVAQAKSLKAVLAEQGINVVGEEMFLNGTSDYSTPLAKIIATKPQAIYTIGINVTPIIKQFKTYKTDIAIYTNNVSVSGNLIFADKDTFDGVHLTGYKSTIPGTDQYIKIRQEIPTASATNTLGYSAAAYDDLMAIRAIMAKDPDPKKLAQTFAALGKFDGINGGYDFTSRSVGMPLYPVIFKNGVLTEVK